MLGINRSVILSSIRGQYCAPKNCFGLAVPTIPHPARGHSHTPSLVTAPVTHKQHTDTVKRKLLASGLRTSYHNRDNLSKTLEVTKRGHDGN